MNLDFLYTCLLGFTWFFLGSWVVLLLAAGVVAFGRDST